EGDTERRVSRVPSPPSATGKARARAPASRTPAASAAAAAAAVRVPLKALGAQRTRNRGLPPIPSSSPLRRPPGDGFRGVISAGADQREVLAQLLGVPDVTVALVHVDKKPRRDPRR